MYLKQFDVGPLNVFCYLVGCERTGEAIVIDPAAECDKVIQVAKEAGLRITKIVNTHGHIDHIMGNKEMKSKTGASIVIHQADASALTDVPSYKLMMFNATASPPPDEVVGDGDRIAFGEESVRVIHTPGHSAGSMCLFTEGFIFTGDTLFVESVGRTDLPGGSWQVLYTSIMERIVTLDQSTVVLPGHNYGRRPTSTVGHEKQYNPYLQ